MTPGRLSVSSLYLNPRPLPIFPRVMPGIPPMYFVRATRMSQG